MFKSAVKAAAQATVLVVVTSVGAIALRLPHPAALRATLIRHVVETKEEP
jgi:hypothetical protein